MSESRGNLNDEVRELFKVAGVLSHNIFEAAKKAQAAGLEEVDLGDLEAIRDAYSWAEDVRVALGRFVGEED